MDLRIALYSAQESDGHESNRRGFVSIWVIEESGCDWGGVCVWAGYFDSEKSAEKWIKCHTVEHNDPHYEAKELKADSSQGVSGAV
jgi:hypothetical protein